MESNGIPEKMKRRKLKLEHKQMSTGVVKVDEAPWEKGLEEPTSTRQET